MSSKSTLIGIFVVGAALLLTGCAQGLLSNATGADSEPGSTSNAVESDAQIKGLSAALDKGEILPSQYIVQVKDSVDPRSAAGSIASKVGGQVIFTYQNALNGFAVRIPGADKGDVKSILNDLTSDQRVKAAIPDSVHKAHSQGIPVGVKRINADQAANIDSVDERVDADIAILDTGVDPTHPDINVVRFKNCVGGRDTDGNGHGSHVAGTAAAIDNGQGVVGVAPGARVWSVKVLSDSGSGPASAIICGIDFVTNHADQIEVANMSLGGRGKNFLEHFALVQSTQAGVFYSVSAGNDNIDVFGNVDGTFDEADGNDPTFNFTPFGIQSLGCFWDDPSDGTDNSPFTDTECDDAIPAAYPEVATVSAMSDVDGERGAIGSPGAADDVFAGFTNFSRSNAAANPLGPFGPNPVSSPGAAIDVAAPGSDVLSTYKQAGLDQLSGTSMASPHVAGAAALYIAENGRDANGDGTRNAQDVFAIRQALVDSGQAQSNWQSGSTGDPDVNAEPLVRTNSFSPSLTTGPCPSDQAEPSQGATVGSDLNCPAKNR